MQDMPHRSSFTLHRAECETECAQSRGADLHLLQCKHVAYAHTRARAEGDPGACPAPFLTQPPAQQHISELSQHLILPVTHIGVGRCFYYIRVLSVSISAAVMYRGCLRYVPLHRTVRMCKAIDQQELPEVISWEK